MKKTFSLVLAALLLAGTTTTVFASDEVNLNEYGTPIMGNKDFVGGTLENVFDGDMTTWADYGVDGGQEYWVGMKFDVPTILNGIELFSYDPDGDGTPVRPHVIYGTVVEGSNDGENWEFILRFGDNYDEYLEYAWDMEDGMVVSAYEYAYDGESTFDEDARDPVAYTYYRVWNNTDGVAVWGDVIFWGTIEEPNYTLGDIDMNGAVDINDAMYLFQSSMLPEIFPDIYPGNADFTKNGSVDIEDALYLFQYTMMPDQYPLA